MKLGTFLAVTVVAFLLSASWTFRGADWETLLGVAEPHSAMAGDLCDVEAGPEFVQFYTGRYSDGPEHWSCWYVKATQVVFVYRQGRPRVEVVDSVVHIYHRQPIGPLTRGEMSADAVFGQLPTLFLLLVNVVGFSVLIARRVRNRRQEGEVIKSLPWGSCSPSAR